MDGGDYDEEDALRDFLKWRWKRYATEEERSWYRLALRREKAADPRWETSHFARRVHAEWKRADEATRLAVEAGAAAIRMGAVERLFRVFREDQRVTGRCPKCQRLLRTPLAQQCPLVRSRLARRAADAALRAEATHAVRVPGTS